MVDELVQFVMADRGLWRFKHSDREGRTRTQLRRDLLDSVFIDTGKSPAPGSMEDSVEPLQDITKFDRQTLQFK